MSFKEQMRVSPSNAEIEVLLALEKAGLTRDMFKDWSICLHETRPDFAWPKKRLLVYLDGPSHDKDVQMLKDSVIDELLQRRGYKVLRISYVPPLRKHALQGIIAQIQEALRE